MILADFSGKEPKVTIVNNKKKREPHAETDWCKDYANVKALARWMNERCEFYTIESVLDYFEAPWKWSSEWREFQAEKAAS